VPERAGSSPTCSFNPPATFPGTGTGAALGFRFRKLGVPSINGARNPACNANSANFFPDGNRQLIGSIHSMGICEITMGERRFPALVLRWLAF
jgi:hypothetical protein